MTKWTNPKASITKCVTIECFMHGLKDITGSIVVK